MILSERLLRRKIIPEQYFYAVLAYFVLSSIGPEKSAQVIFRLSYLQISDKLFCSHYEF